MRSTLIRIGNSRGIRLPKALIEEAGLTREIDIRAEQGKIIVTAVGSPRDGWAEAAAERPSEGLLDEPTSTEFDEQEWDW